MINVISADLAQELKNLNDVLTVEPKVTAIPRNSEKQAL